MVFLPSPDDMFREFTRKNVDVSNGRAAQMGKPSKEQLVAIQRMKDNSVADYFEHLCNIEQKDVYLTFLDLTVCFPEHLKTMEVTFGQAISMDTTKTFEQRMAEQVVFVSVIVPVPGAEPRVLLQGGKEKEMEKAAISFIKAVNLEMEKHIQAQEKAGGSGGSDGTGGDRDGAESTRTTATAATTTSTSPFPPRSSSLSYGTRAVEGWSPLH
ncbi:hypothetical protein K490DRAFT_65266 [Saccharata proteae CBS 121410]|uniref:Uncharacterized protein n=1 Tax=Saccharata proteae CBS 121410 TaxID=1314787 RepID=A0A9P4HWZ1_9PEZI|nr:hypothetical protein K490DRAFT_65266 [Saccharata proteae CBS 121410]